MGAGREYSPLDDVDRKILQLLQRDARNSTAVEIAAELDVSDGTVRNRIKRLEDEGIIEGYAPLINYERAGYQLEITITCTAPIVEREEMARRALQIEGVVEVEEITTGRENVAVVAVAPEHDDLTRITASLDELSLEVEREELLRHHYVRPFNHFGADDVNDDRDGTHDV